MEGRILRLVDLPTLPLPPLRLPVIQALAAEVRLTTQSLLSQLLQKLRSNIQVSSTHVIICKQAVSFI